MADGDLYLPHLSLTFGGSFWGSEIWQMGLRLSAGVYDTPTLRFDFCEAKLDDVATDVTSWFAHNNSGTSKQAHLDWVKFNPIGADGKYENKATTLSKRIVSSPTGGDFPYSGSGTLPPQVALVLSLRTGNRGPREAWGHVYMPCQSLQLDGSKPTLSTNAINNVAAKFAEFVNALNNWPGIDPLDGPVVSVVSKYSDYTDKRTGVHKTFQAAITPVTDVWVGDKYDTHRSRANKISQTYSKVALES
ncbi:MAG TPA: hypothetical protein VK176_03610 [Phycisphaerales bacterium]|nr:hypothetical protein [Phycisphaerales bacterium]